MIRELVSKDINGMERPDPVFVSQEGHDIKGDKEGGRVVDYAFER